MVLPQTVEYALRIMSQLAIAEKGTLVPARDLSERVEVPAAYLSKVLRKLVVAGLLESQRGHNGGFSLARPRAKIRLVDIFDAVDYSFESQRCAFGWGQCDAKQPCPLHGVWSQFTETASDWARRRTLEDIYRNWVGVPHVDRRRLNVLT